MAKIVDKKQFNLPSNFIGNGDNRLLPLNAQRLLFYACWKCPENSTKVEFTLSELRDQFKQPFKDFENIKKALTQLYYYGFVFSDDEEEYFEARHVFTDIRFKNGIFTLKFNDGFQEQIKETKKQFLKYGLGIVSEWQCKYTVLLYNYLKEKMFASSTKYFTLKELRGLFKLEEKEYLNNTDFKFYCWSKAVEEINRTTGYIVNITPSGRGKNIIYELKICDKETIVSAEHNTQSEKSKPIDTATHKKERKGRIIEPIPDWLAEEWFEKGRIEELKRHGYDPEELKRKIERKKQNEETTVEEILKSKELSAFEFDYDSFQKIFG